ncbi:MAG: hypothetical protein HY864_15965 [Chloroflexi bacterium]|nr:hypothetical protein [Chloroflexota bacterium]
MTAVSFYVQIVKALDEIGASYMIVGAFGGYPFGITRVTFDIMWNKTLARAKEEIEKGDTPRKW